jgi:tetratricopeptide (TPR) repeat protein
LFGQLVAIAEEVGHPVMRWMAVFAAAQWALLRGETAAGEALAEEALAVGQALGQPDAFNYFATQISHARWQQGRLDELVDLIEVGARDNPGIPAYQGALARALCQAGRHDEARSLLDRATGSAFADLPEDLLWSYGMSTYAEVAIQLDHAEGAALLYERLAPFDQHLTFVGTACEGPIAHYLGGLATVLGRFDAADRHLATAAALADRAGSPFYTARTLIEQGRLAVRRGRATAAGRLLADGRDLAGRWGFAGEERRATRALADLG